MTLQQAIARIENIPVTQVYTDSEGQLLGKALTHWIDIKPIVLSIFKELQEQDESEIEANVEEEHLRSGD